MTPFTYDFELLSGNEQISQTDKALIDYWRWAHSDINSNTERGTFAEYLVSQAVNAQTLTRKEWESYDILSPEGIRIVVKASGYIQSWAPQKTSKIVFSVRPTHAWDSRTNVYAPECKRQADIYVFCVLQNTNRETLNPLDTEQWDFYVLPTAILDREAPGQKQIALSGLIRLGAKVTDFKNLRKTIMSEVGIDV